MGNLRRVELVPVIKTVTFEGNGTVDKPNTLVTQYWSMEGREIKDMGQLEVSPPVEFGGLFKQNLSGFSRNIPFGEEQLNSCD